MFPYSIIILINVHFRTFLCLKSFSSYRKSMKLNYLVDKMRWAVSKTVESFDFLLITSS